MAIEINIDASAYVKKTELPSNLTLYPTNVASGVAGYSLMVTSHDDPNYNTVAVDVVTPPITGASILVASLATNAGVLTGNPGEINLTTVGNVKRNSGTSNAVFYYELYHRTSAGVETLLATSSMTAEVSNTIYEQFNASALLNNGTWLSTDLIVIKYYATKVGGGSSSVFSFQFGGTSPVRTILPVPASVLLDIPIQADVTEAVDFTDGHLVGVSSGKVSDVDPLTLPVSTATQTALDAKLSNTDDTFRGQLNLVGTIKQSYEENRFNLNRPVANEEYFIVNPSTAVSANTDFHGVDLKSITSGSNINNFSSIYPFETQIFHFTSQPINRCVGAYSLVENSGSGNMSNACGLQLWNRNRGSGTLTTSQGILIKNPLNDGVGVITNAYGIYIDNFTTGSVRNYGIYSLANNLFRTFEIQETTQITNLNSEFCGGFKGAFMPAGEDARAVSNTTNPNLITKSGFYSAANLAINTPIASQFWNIMHTAMKGTLNYHVQVAINVESGRMFTRHQKNGTWAAWSETQRSISGATGARPSAVNIGLQYFDTTLGKPIWWNGSVWKDATGATV